MGQFLAFVEEAARGTDPGSGYKFLPVRNDIEPETVAVDESTKEFRGQDVALGDLTARRKQLDWKLTVEVPFIPGDEIGLLLKHFFGFAGTRTVVDTTAYKGILYPLRAPFGDGANLGDKAIGIVPNTDEDGTTKSRYYGGGRITKASLKAEVGNELIWTFEIQGPGDYIGAEAAETAGASMPVTSPFTMSDLTCYIGDGISRTGTGPDFTDIAPGTMNAFYPDSISLDLTNGLADKVVPGYLGATKTHRSAQFSGEIAVPIDYEDPASGFSSAAEYKAFILALQTANVLLVADNGEVAGSTTENFSFALDLANLLAQHGKPSRNAEGITPTVELKYKTQNDTTTKYPAACQIVDTEAAY